MSKIKGKVYRIIAFALLLPILSGLVLGSSILANAEESAAIGDSVEMKEEAVSMDKSPDESNLVDSMNDSDDSDFMRTETEKKEIIDDSVYEKENANSEEELVTDPIENKEADSESTDKVDNESKEGPLYKNLIGKIYSEEIDFSSYGIDSSRLEVRYEFYDDTEAGMIVDCYEEDDSFILLVANEETKLSFEDEEINLLSSFSLMSFIEEEESSEAYPNWEALPMTYENNWDNSNNCWYYGEWINGTQYKTDVGSYDTNVRNGVQLYSDGNYVYLRVVYSLSNTSYGNTNGSDFNFKFGDQVAKFQLWNNGTIDHNSYAPGSTNIEVRNGDGSISHNLASGAYATYYKDPNGRNDEVSLAIPMEAFLEQNSNINTNSQTITWYCPNLTYREVSCGGTSTGSTGFIFLTAVFFGASMLAMSKKKMFKWELA